MDVTNPTHFNNIVSHSHKTHARFPPALHHNTILIIAASLSFITFTYSSETPLQRVHVACGLTPQIKKLPEFIRDEKMLNESIREKLTRLTGCCSSNPDTGNQFTEEAKLRFERISSAEQMLHLFSKERIFSSWAFFLVESLVDEHSLEKIKGVANGAYSNAKNELVDIVKELQNHEMAELDIQQTTQKITRLWDEISDQNEKLLKVKFLKSRTLGQVKNLAIFAKYISQHMHNLNIYINSKKDNPLVQGVEGALTDMMAILDSIEDMQKGVDYHANFCFLNKMIESLQ